MSNSCSPCSLVPISLSPSFPFPRRRRQLPSSGDISAKTKMKSMSRTPHPVDQSCLHNATSHPFTILFPLNRRKIFSNNAITSQLHATHPIKDGRCTRIAKLVSQLYNLQLTATKTFWVYPHASKHFRHRSKYLLRTNTCNLPKSLVNGAKKSTYLWSVNVL